MTTVDGRSLRGETLFLTESWTELLSRKHRKVFRRLDYRYALSLMKQALVIPASTRDQAFLNWPNFAVFDPYEAGTRRHYIQNSENCIQNFG